MQRSFNIQMRSGKSYVVTAHNLAHAIAKAISDAMAGIGGENINYSDIDCVKATTTTPIGMQPNSVICSSQLSLSPPRQHNHQVDCPNDTTPHHPDIPTPPAK